MKLVAVDYTTVKEIKTAYVLCGQEFLEQVKNLEFSHDAMTVKRLKLNSELFKKFSKLYTLCTLLMIIRSLQKNVNCSH